MHNMSRRVSIWKQIRSAYYVRVEEMEFLEKYLHEGEAYNLKAEYIKIFEKMAKDLKSEQYGHDHKEFINAIGVTIDQYNYIINHNCDHSQVPYYEIEKCSKSNKYVKCEHCEEFISKKEKQLFLRKKYCVSDNDRKKLSSYMYNHALDSGLDRIFQKYGSDTADTADIVSADTMSADTMSSDTMSADAMPANKIMPNVDKKRSCCLM